MILLHGNEPPPAEEAIISGEKGKPLSIEKSRCLHYWRLHAPLRPLSPRDLVLECGGPIGQQPSALVTTIVSSGQLEDMDQCLPGISRINHVLDKV